MKKKNVPKRDKNLSFLASKSSLRKDQSNFFFNISLNFRTFEILINNLLVFLVSVSLQ